MSRKLLKLTHLPRWLTFLFLGLVFLMILIFRQAELITNPQFFAEDGRVWYSQVYNNGLTESLSQPQDGYFQTFPKLVSGIANQFPLAQGPIIFTLFALIFQIIPSLLFVSKRFETILPNIWLRVLFGIMILILPNVFEVHGNLTNTQWFISLAACFILLGRSNSKIQKIIDYSILTLCALTGPFTILLAPIALLIWLIRKNWGSFVHVLILGGGALLQTLSLLFLSHSERLSTLPKLSLPLIGRIINRQILLGNFAGPYSFVVLHQDSIVFWGVSLVIALLVLYIVVYTFSRKYIEFWLFGLYSSFIFITSLLSPTTVQKSGNALLELYLSHSGVRYWLVPLIWLCWLIPIGLLHSKRFVQVGALILLFAFGTAAIQEYRLPPPRDRNFSEWVEKYNQTRVGEKITIPINPEGWSFTLQKK